MSASDIRGWDQQNVICKVNDSGLSKIYTGLLYFAGGEDTVMIGMDEIIVDCIEWIKLAE